MKHIIAVSEKIYRKNDGVWKLISSPKPNKFPTKEIALEYINSKYPGMLIEDTKNCMVEERSFSKGDDRIVEFTSFHGIRKVVVLVYKMNYRSLNE
jgi:hypothetical protein